MDIKTKRIMGFIAVVLGYALASVDTTIVNIALPRIASYYNIQMSVAAWIVNSFNIAFAVFIVTASGIADQFGRKKIFLIGYFIFIVSSIMAGISKSFEMLVIFRAIQGLSAAIIVPVAIPLFTTIFPREKHGAVIGLGGSITGLAVAVGPTLGGIITQTLSWEWIFFINVPICIVGFILAVIAIPESYDPNATKKVDIAGILCISVGMFAITYSIIQANDLGWTSWEFIRLMLVGIIAFIGFVFIELKIKAPMLPMWLMKIRAFNCANISFLFIGAGVTGSIYLMSFYLTKVMGMNAIEAGVTISALPFITCFIAPVAGAKSNKYGSRWFIVGGIFFTSVGMFLLSGVDVSSSRIDIIWRLLILGVGYGLPVAPILRAVIRNVPPEKVGIASGINNMSRFFGSALGVALFVAILNLNLGNQNDIGHLQSAFSSTFKIGSFILMPGVIFGYFSDKKIIVEKEKTKDVATE